FLLAYRVERSRTTAVMGCVLRRQRGTVDAVGVGTGFIGTSQLRRMAFQWASVIWSLGVIQMRRAPPSTEAASAADRSSGEIALPPRPHSPSDIVQRPGSSVAARREARARDAAGARHSRDG